MYFKWSPYCNESYLPIFMHETCMSTDQAAAHSRLTSVVWPIQSFGWVRVLEGGFILPVCLCLCSQYWSGLCWRPAVCHPLSAGEDRNPQLVRRVGHIHWSSDLWRKKADLSFLVSLTRTDEATPPSPFPFSKWRTEMSREPTSAIDLFCTSQDLKINRSGVPAIQCSCFNHEDNLAAFYWSKTQTGSQIQVQFFYVQLGFVIDCGWVYPKSFIKTPPSLLLKNL